MPVINNIGMLYVRNTEGKLVPLPVLKGEKGDPGVSVRFGVTNLSPAQGGGYLITVEDTDGSSWKTHIRDGKSVSLESVDESDEDGGTNTVLFTDGTVLKIKNGSRGGDGSDGKDGKDGTDGITPHIGENGNWFIGETDTGASSEGFRFADSAEECTDIHTLYVLSDGKVYAYRDEELPQFDNLADSTADGWVDDAAFVSNNSQPGEAVGAVTSNYIAVNKGDVIRVSGCDITANRQGLYKSDENGNPVHYASLSYTSSTLKSHFDVVQEGDIWVFTAKAATVKYIRFSGTKTGKVAITSNQPITYNKGLVFSNLGYSFITGEFDRRVGTVEEVLDENTTAISDITARVTALEAPVLPSFWEAEVTKTAADVRAVLDAWGRDALAFAMFSDNHGSTRYTGTILRRLVDECSLDYVVNCGDSFTSNYIETEAEAEEMLASFARMMEVIPAEMLLQTVGNHDVSWGKDGSRVYIKNYSPAKRFNRFLKQAEAAGRVYGGDGTYFYTDHHASKTRFVVLNSTWVHYEEDANGEAVYNHTGDHGFGQAQLEWLADVALRFDEEGWGVVFISHCPISNRTTAYLRDVKVLRGMLEAFKAKEAFEGVYSDETIPEVHRVNLYVDFTGYTSAELIGWFCGHSHYDVIETMDATPGSTEAEALPLVCVSVTCDHYYYHRGAEGE